jgi:hypothetical protein
MAKDLYQRKGSTPQCANCGQPFAIMGDYMACWRASSGRFFCSEYCAEGEEQSQLKKAS